MLRQRWEKRQVINQKTNVDLLLHQDTSTLLQALAWPTIPIHATKPKTPVANPVGPVITLYLQRGWLCARVYIGSYFEYILLILVFYWWLSCL